MSQQPAFAVENNFTKGLITESSGLNFPENASTDTDNCVYTLIGEVLRRPGFDYETNHGFYLTDRTGRAISEYKWDNAGGDGLTQIIVSQIGNTLFFTPSSQATIAAPISALMGVIAPIAMSQFALGTFDISLECQFTSGNGYLFVFHPSCDPFYISYTSGTLSATRITVQIRDFTGVSEPSVGLNVRPAVLTAEHTYNLINQGWTAGAPWQGLSTTVQVASLGIKVFTVQAGLAAAAGNQVSMVSTIDAFPGGIFQPAGTSILSGTVTGYVGTTLTINATAVNPYWAGDAWSAWAINPTSTGFINTWFSAVGNYPSNADVWWYFKNSSGVFDPATTIGNVTFNSGPAPKGHFTVDAFSQQRSLVSSVSGLTDITTNQRPKTGTWFQGRIWYTGVDAQQPATGDAAYYTWTENIYFSQVAVDNTYFGKCYQTNDPTSEQFFDLLPTDGGVIVIQGSGSIFKLFPIQNGMLVFAANGVWFITGSQGIGFSANDYTITKISAVQSISSTSFVDVQGLPYFWNEDGIYAVQPTQGGSLVVNPLTVGTILSFYSDIPFASKKFVRGAYDPIEYKIQWIYRSDNETTVTDRYQFDRVLNFNTYNKAFFPYTIANTGINADPWVHSILYVVGPGGGTSPPPMLKFFSSAFFGGQYNFTFSDESSTEYVDWFSSNDVGYEYSSFFITGYKLRGQAIREFQPQYVQIWAKPNPDTISSGYNIQSIWDYAVNRNSGKWSALQYVRVYNDANFSMFRKRHRLRGSGQSVQFKITSIDNVPFNIAGWAVYDTVNAQV